jgi:hypothetical protein
MTASGMTRSGAGRPAIPGALAAIVLGLTPPSPARATGAALDGMTGLVNTPTAEVLPDASVRLGAAEVDEEWAFHGRGRMDNRIFTVALGFLPRTEVAIRATWLPELSLLELQSATVVDRLAAGRLLVLTEAALRPAVAVGIDDVRGTRLFHSSYVVATKTLLASGPLLRASLGRGLRVLDAGEYVLDGTFGGVEIGWGPVSALLDFDTEKWNSGARLTAFGHVGAHLALLDLDTPSGGLTWIHRF